MNSERGFTLTEMMAALIVLSLGLMSFGSLTDNLIKAWSFTEKSHASVFGRQILMEKIIEYENTLRSDADADADQSRFLIGGNSSELAFASAKLDQAPSCDFELVSRRCR